jgi:hypothetical protein
MTFTYALHVVIVDATFVGIGVVVAILLEGRLGVSFALLTLVSSFCL